LPGGFFIWPAKDVRVSYAIYGCQYISLEISVFEINVV